MSACDEWAGTLNGTGYGTIYIAKTSDNKSGCWGAHRIVWMQDNGHIPDDMVIMHTCDNRRCINIDHLRLGTQSENIYDAVAKGRLPSGRGTHCNSGHLWSEETIYVHPNGQWHCKPCRRIADKKRGWRRRKAAA